MTGRFSITHGSISGGLSPTSSSQLRAHTDIDDNSLFFDGDALTDLVRSRHRVKYEPADSALSVTPKSVRFFSSARDSRKCQTDPNRAALV